MLILHDDEAVSADLQVRGYKEHQCRFIFRLADVDLGVLGHVFGLLRMPRMAEIKHAAVALKNFRPSPVDPDTVKARAALMSAKSVYTEQHLPPASAQCPVGKLINLVLHAVPEQGEGEAASEVAEAGGRRRRAATTSTQPTAQQLR